VASRIQTFTADVVSGQRAPSVVVPFDPERTWGLAPTPQPFFDGEVPGWPVKGLFGGHRFQGAIGRRWGKHFLLLPEGTEATLGSRVQVIVEPRL